DFGPLCRHRKSFEVTSAGKQLVLEGEITQKGLIERLSLLAKSLDRCSSAAEERSDDVGDTPELPDHTRNSLGALAAIRGALRQLATHRLRACLRDAGIGDLNLRVREIKQRAQLREQ